MKLIAPTLALALLSSTSLVMAQSTKPPASSPPPAANTQPSSPSTSSGAPSGPSSGSTTEAVTSPGFSSSQSDADIDRRLAQVKSALQLSDQQLSHWTAAEGAMKDMLRQHEQWRLRREDFRSRGYSGQGSNSLGSERIEQMRRMGQMMSERGAAMTRLADAVKPLYDSLSEDQRRRLHSAIHDAMIQEHGRMGRNASPENGHGDRWNDRDGGYGSRYRNDGDRWGEWHRDRSDTPYEDRSWNQRNWNQRNWRDRSWDRGYGDRGYGGYGNRWSDGDYGRSYNRDRNEHDHSGRGMSPGYRSYNNDNDDDHDQD